MKPLIAKISHSDLATFLQRNGKRWWIYAHPAFEEKLPHQPVTTAEFIDACKSYEPEKDYIYVFSHQESVYDIIHQVDFTAAEFIAADQLDQYIVRSGQGKDFLWIFASDNDASNASYLTIIPYEEEAEEILEESHHDKYVHRLSGISIENFKGIRERVDIDLRPITLMFGANSAGKSSILHALHYAREIFERRNLNPDRTMSGGSFVDLGGFKNFVHGRDMNRAITLGFSLDLRDAVVPTFERIPSASFPDEPIPMVHRVNSANIEVVIAWSEILNTAYVKSYTVGINGTRLGQLAYQPGRREVELTLDWTHPIFIKLSEGEGYDHENNDAEDNRTGIREVWEAGFGFGEDKIYILNQPDALVLFDQQIQIRTGIDPEDKIWSFGAAMSNVECVQGTLTHLFAGIGTVLRDTLMSSRYLGPLREVPPRNFEPPRFPDPSRWASGLGAWDALQNGPGTLVESVSSWLTDSDKLAADYQIERKTFKELDLANPLVIKLLSGRAFEDAEEGSRIELDRLPTQSRIVVTTKNSRLELRPSDVGIGVSQVVPVIVSALSEERRIVCIEQPELHIHPSLQTRLGDLFIEAFRQKQNQFIIETHSEHLILRLQRRIRETTKGTCVAGRELNSEDVAVYYVSGDANGTTARRIDIDMNGDFVQSWPDDFFEIDFHERFS